ncbi:peptide/nickel transport system permease protein [Paramicrobacterium humi]|uniref:Peptide/nickel transport system permease protein n=1 Tax=Paramicrobacterium humi TaxID=640635 RepID=A0A1H4Q7U7_9MICO|nr:ABC transporter permease [Microbacterium humi]SEC15669.1 peptide/nickel transport system permease protein [Microbacterium humi]
MTVRTNATPSPRAWRWLIVRLLGAVAVLWAVATVVFFAMRLIPGDPAEAILGGPGSQASAEALAAVRAEYGLDRPLLLQYLGQLGRLATGDLGTSYSLKAPVGSIIAGQLGNTLVLAVLSLALAWLIALALSLYSTRGGRVPAAVGNAIELTAAALPHFWLAAILIATFSTGLGWLPPVSTAEPASLILPVVTLAVPTAGFLTQVMRDSLLDALDAPFALSARARGSSELRVRLVHAIRHAAVPGVNLTAWAFGYLVSGAVVVETIFARPGLGRSLLRAVTARDVPMVTGVVLVTALAYVVITVAADAATRVIDPRTAGAA